MNKKHFIKIVLLIFLVSILITIPILSKMQNNRRCYQVLNLLFNCPDEEIIYALNQDITNGNVSVIGINSNNSKNPQNSQLNEVLNRKTEKLFTPKQKELFNKKYLLSFHLNTYQKNIKTLCQNIELIKSSNNKFDFVVSIKILQSGMQDTVNNIKGVISFDDYGKIMHFNITEGYEIFG